MEAASLAFWAGLVFLYALFHWLCAGISGAGVSIVASPLWPIMAHYGSSIYT
ncbi:hypothetical protein [Pontibacter anaerobius]|uniref:Uncharacterized protein n=1 Tax=Pontibacter anaerobius TaxID=2993940 RepID=A0ABT3RFW9_9BACT|nr:hypothetical protein [Pontibacter anaerobius]MCX2740723.1 hypothetical protein [Pontibacter anaerobius]